MNKSNKIKKRTRKKKKYALLFGFGKQSCALLKRYKRFKPTLVFLHHKGCDANPLTLKWIAERHNLPYLILKTSDTTYATTLIHEGEKVTSHLDNIILKKKFLKQKFDIILYGRRRLDYYERGIMKPGEKLQHEEPIIKTPGGEIHFPFWDEK